MPTYEYRCKDCNHRFDAVQAFTDDALTECPVCGGALKKVFGSVGITFKGSGFYKTDSRAGAAKSDNGDKSGDKSPEKVGASTDGAASKDGSTNGSSGKDGSSASSSDSGKSGSGTSDSGKSSKGDSKPSGSASKAASKSGS